MANQGKKYVYLFEEGGAGMKGLLGGKGANLAEMTRIGLPVPPGFTVSTEACIEYMKNGGVIPSGLEDEVSEKLELIERKTGKKFGGGQKPLLVSVRSGAAVSMPGMMDTILNLGLNEKSVSGLSAATGDERFAYDCYRRFIQMFGNVVMKIEHSEFEEILEEHKGRAGIKYDVEMDADTLRRVVDDYLGLVRRKVGREFPADPAEQLRMAVKAVFESWNNPRAVIYRRLNRIPDDLGTAVNVQTMVFGNMGANSGTGVVFTRNPSTGEKGLYGEYLANAQGEDVVAGIRTPKPIAELEQEMPEAYRQLKDVCDLLERRYSDVQDIEFTVEEGKLYILQTRAAKRTAGAAVRIAHDLVKEGMIDREEAVMRVEPEQVVRLLHRNVDPSARFDVLAKGLPASPGAACGTVVFDADEAERLGKEGKRVILVRPETTPDDIHGIIEAQGVLTNRGGMTCHAAIVARGMGKPCVVGCEAMKIDLDQKRFSVGDVVVGEGDVLSIDGTTGAVILGEVPLVDPQLGGEFEVVLRWADEIRRLGVRANADTPEDARKAREFGAEGIGLCRTEHMFMAVDRLPVVQRMIMAETEEERKRALDELLPLQQGDFEGILEAMEGLPVTIRLLDPPLHEFLPNVEQLLVEVTTLRLKGGDLKEIAEKEELLRKARALSEFNPMLGHRGCRLGLVYPEIYEMQVRAILRAVASLKKRGVKAKAEIMIPLVGHFKELEMMRELVERVADDVSRETGIDVRCPIGTMIEVPRAALTAGEIAEYAEFFSFGTNDLTQTTYGFSRDDAEAKFLHHYLQKRILPENPFAVLDRTGVGRLVKIAIEEGRAKRPALKVGICGEHGGEPTSIEFCHTVGMDYVSCSPFRVPVARLAAAQAVIREKRGIIESPSLSPTE